MPALTGRHGRRPEAAVDDADVDGRSDAATLLSLEAQLASAKFVAGEAGSTAWNGRASDERKTEAGKIVA
ncbi:hypothetical protein MRX96_007380 [Rhipicephalus microplus]